MAQQAPTVPDDGRTTRRGTQRWTPQGPSRGTVVLLHGRGEHPRLYERLGTRLSADGYTLIAPGDVPGTKAAPGDLDSLEELFASGGGGPRVLLGTDSGALAAARLAERRPSAFTGLILAGLPLAPPVRRPENRDDELAARTACGVHTALLSGDPGFRWGALDEPLELPASSWRLPRLPSLVLHGGADPIAPLRPVEALVRKQPTATLVVTPGGAHDVLNDKDHRSVAARIVLFLEGLGGAGAPPARTRPRSSQGTRRPSVMNISARADYAVRAALHLAGTGDTPTKCETIARAQDIPLNFLNGLMGSLRQAGLVNSQRGCDGGYWLARPPEAISVADVMRAVEGPLAAVQGGDPADLVYNGEARPLREVWLAVQRGLEAMLGQVTLRHLIDGELPPELLRHAPDPA